MLSLLLELLWVTLDACIITAKNNIYLVVNGSVIQSAWCDFSVKTDTSPSPLCFISVFLKSLFSLTLHFSLLCICITHTHACLSILSLFISHSSRLSHLLQPPSASPHNLIPSNKFWSGSSNFCHFLLSTKPSELCHEALFYVLYLRQSAAVSL